MVLNYLWGWNIQGLELHGRGVKNRGNRVTNGVENGGGEATECRLTANLLIILFPFPVWGTFLCKRRGAFFGVFTDKNWPNQRPL